MSYEKDSQIHSSQKLEQGDSWTQETTGMAAYVPEEVVRCRRMLVAMLKNLILDLRGEAVTRLSGGAATQERKSLMLQARQYVFSARRDEFSFSWLCEELEVDYNWFKEEVRTGNIGQWNRGADSSEHNLGFGVRHA